MVVGVLLGTSFVCGPAVTAAAAAPAAAPAAASPSSRSRVVSRAGVSRGSAGAVGDVPV